MRILYFAAKINKDLNNERLSLLLDRIHYLQASSYQPSTSNRLSQVS